MLWQFFKFFIRYNNSLYMVYDTNHKLNNLIELKKSHFSELN